ncbi:hypothetical protein FRACYDRAFT_233576 [Fragilariopsis cylindrus CCMP1102]|uniref:Uncharacterized protein n=1 Tax=Fragilariopsis cylindrus CCMP1102 TaxID=635003 RepID=A0A1E7G005_9STRA|nr:hypothetical protein FRACYDRAFT_233576 [Fragilariopsis cylindrus CCMP1102]|eukprot:OEU23403.1 hypothetical protein FRACYDRAFT_233576 [Fragilariopsis cylindrus CCMP1102]
MKKKNEAAAAAGSGGSRDNDDIFYDTMTTAAPAITTTVAAAKEEASAGPDNSTINKNIDLKIKNKQQQQHHEAVIKKMHSGVAGGHSISQLKAEEKRLVFDIYSQAILLSHIGDPKKRLKNCHPLIDTAYAFGISIAAVKHLYDKYSKTNGTFARTTRSDKFRFDDTDEANANRKRVQPRSRNGTFASAYKTVVSASATTIPTGTKKTAARTTVTGDGTATAATSTAAAATAEAKNNVALINPNNYNPPPANDFCNVRAV